MNSSGSTVQVFDESDPQMEQRTDDDTDGEEGREEGREEDEDENSDSLPEGDPLDADAAIAEERARSRSYLKNWYPEDATAPGWQQEKSETDFRPPIEMALKENLIHFSSVAGPGGLYKVCVLPEDEARAREIVQEIVEIVDDQPPD